MLQKIWSFRINKFERINWLTRKSDCDMFCHMGKNSRWLWYFWLGRSTSHQQSLRLSANKDNHEQEFNNLCMIEGFLRGLMLPFRWVGENLGQTKCPVFQFDNARSKSLWKGRSGRMWRTNSRQTAFGSWTLFDVGKKEKVLETSNMVQA